MVAEAASRGIDLPLRRRQPQQHCKPRRRRRLSPPRPSSPIAIQPHQDRHHEIYEEEHFDGPRLSSSSDESDTSFENSLSNSGNSFGGISDKSDLFGRSVSSGDDVSLNSNDDNNNNNSDDDDDDDIIQVVESPVPVLKRAPSLNRGSTRQVCYQSSRLRHSGRQLGRRLSSARRSSRTSGSSPEDNTGGSWHVRAADKFLRDAEANNVDASDVVHYATSLLNQHIEAIKNEELVLDWGSVRNTPRPSLDSAALTSDFAKITAATPRPSVADINCCNDNRSLPAEAFPPSLIKWPANNNNKQKRLAEIKKQVKLLSSIIKMTIEGSHEQQHGAAGANARGFSNPAPFTSFVDMSLLPRAALANASAEESFLPTIDEITEHLRANKIKEAKAVLRSAGGAVTCPTRPTLWKEMCKRQTTEQFSDSFYYDTLQQIYGTKDLNDCRVVLPVFVDHGHLGRGLTPEGLAACGRIISVLAYYYPPITYAPALHPLAACLLLYMNESDVYNSLSALICSSKVTFATQTKIAHEVAWRTTLTLARKHVGAGFSTLEKYGIRPKHVEAAFENWLWWILEGIPIPHMIRIVDCYLLEGWKVLVRVGLAIFQLFIRQVSRDPSTAALLSTKGLSDAIMRFCSSMTITPAKLLKTAFGIRALSKAEIQKVMTRTEHTLKEQGCAKDLSHHEVADLSRALSIEGLPTSSAQADIQMLSHTLNVKEGASPAPRTRALGDYPIRHLVSKIANTDELLTIWNWLPVRMTMYQPSLLYTTEEHGSSLTTFYQRVENHEPTILLIRTTCDHVFGAYCSVAWNTRHKRDEFGSKQTYYGTGETFLFTLRPVPAKYQWVGITQQQQNAALSHVKHSAELFMHGADDMITIGGGEGQGIMLDQELQFGKTDTCQTFDNPPLCATRDFEIKVVEVYGIDVTNA